MNNFPLRVRQEVVRAGENFPHRRVVRHDGKDHVGAGAHVAQSRAGRAPQFLRQRGRRRAIHVEDRRDVKAAILQPTRHVRAHSAYANETDIHVCSFSW